MCSFALNRAGRAIAVGLTPTSLRWLFCNPAWIPPVQLSCWSPPKFISCQLLSARAQSLLTICTASSLLLSSSSAPSKSPSVAFPHVWKEYQRCFQVTQSFCLRCYPLCKGAYRAHLPIEKPTFASRHTKTINRDRTIKGCPSSFPSIQGRDDLIFLASWRALEPRSSANSKKLSKLRHESTVYPSGHPPVFLQPEGRNSPVRILFVFQLTHIAYLFARLS